jgi:hypothetical protein
MSSDQFFRVSRQIASMMFIDASSGTHSLPQAAIANFSLDFQRPYRFRRPYVSLQCRLSETEKIVDSFFDRGRPLIGLKNGMLGGALIGSCRIEECKTSRSQQDYRAAGDKRFPRHAGYRQYPLVAMWLHTRKL